MLEHIETAHSMSASLYRAKFMSKYVDYLKKRRGSERPEPISDSRPPAKADSASISFYEDGASDEVMIWARGCIYHCKDCSTDIPGALAFEFHQGPIL